MPNVIRIQDIQGDGLYSPYAGEVVSTIGIVTGRTRHGFFMQDGDVDLSQAQTRSSGIFVFCTSVPEGLTRGVGMLVRVLGEVCDFVKADNDRPTTQILLEGLEVLQMNCELPATFWLEGEDLPLSAEEIAPYLNGLEGMRVGIRAGAKFSAPSNPFGDYVVVPKGMRQRIPLSCYGTAILDERNPELWLPGFRVNRVDTAPIVNVGDVLAEDVIGPLNYRSDSFQIVARGPIKVDRSRVPHINRSVPPANPDEFVSILTLNAFNLDHHVEHPSRVDDPSRDIDDDLGDQRFHKLAEVIVKFAAAPSIVALQEIQDDDGAEITDQVEATETYRHLIEAVRQIDGPHYQFVDLAPVSGADGGQPGGNIRNAYLFDPARVQLLPDSVQRFGDGQEAYDGSRKALRARFMHRQSAKTLEVFNVHLASKRHQHSIFAPEKPGFDSRESQRIEQARLIRVELDQTEKQGVPYLVTGDFNDFDFSETVRTICGTTAINLMDLVPRDQRFDYNHRGKLHTLMHAIVPKAFEDSARHHFEILHGNELIGIEPGTMGTRATDHGYVLTYLKL